MLFTFYEQKEFSRKFGKQWKIQDGGRIIESYFTFQQWPDLFGEMLDQLQFIEKTGIETLELGRQIVDILP